MQHTDKTVCQCVQLSSSSNSTRLRLFPLINCHILVRSWKYERSVFSLFISHNFVPGTKITVSFSNDNERFQACLPDSLCRCNQMRLQRTEEKQQMRCNLEEDQCRYIAVIILYIPLDRKFATSINIQQQRRIHFYSWVWFRFLFKVIKM